MRSRVSSRSAWLVAFACLTAARPALADEPDQRSIPPFVMVVADTSGSMEYRPDCVCNTEGCVECLPICTADNSEAGLKLKKNRWAVLLEALTGEFNDYQCRPLQRTAPNFTGEYDLGYPKPYHRPWRCTPDVEGATCNYPGSIENPIPIGGTAFQKANGLLDNYANSIRFGLATFDGKRTYGDKSDLVKASDFGVNSEALSKGVLGSYSYGGGKILRYPSCDDDYMIDSGIRSARADQGGLISLNTCAANEVCTAAAQNAKIQDVLLRTRTFGGTPIASALDDLYYHYANPNELKDTLKSCRDRYAILITDGYPDDDFREYPQPGCDCANDPNGCGITDPAIIKKMHCPYPLATKAAENLVEGADDTTDGPQIKQLFVVGMSINDAVSKARLDDVARYGKSPKNADGNYAFFADQASTLTSTLDSLLSSIPRPISRSVPAFVTGLGGVQYQISAGFKISPVTPPSGFTTPWVGILERRRFECIEGGVLSSPDLTDDDKFNETLNKRLGTQRSLLTWLPSNATTSADKSLTRIAGECGTTGCVKTELNSVTKERFGVDDARLPVLRNWMYGGPGSVRETQKLGDIYHSSPTVVGPPLEDPGDQSYSLFRGSDMVKGRPIIVYINSNDGILHAFSLEKYPVDDFPKSTYASYAELSMAAGHELWGFVPPMLLNELNQQLTAHRLNLDATPVVKDVYFSKTTAPSVDDYHTVLITGMRGGGNGYVALDVTDPTLPKFLWQFTDDDMGETYGQPEIVQAVYPSPLGTAPAPHAMVILSGGKGKAGKLGDPGCVADSTGVLTTSSARLPSSDTRYATKSDPDKLSAGSLPHRAAVQCWQSTGRALYFVDVETGRLIKKIYKDDNGNLIFPSPVSGSPTAYQDTVGSIATEGFVLDADGVLWRIDLTADEPLDKGLSGWTVRPFHDLFWDRGAAQGDTSYERPILSLDESHRLVVLLGTGDTDHFDKLTAMNRVVSLTEITPVTPTQPSDYTAALNWEHIVDNKTGDMVMSELVTGSMALFQGQLFVPTFISQPDTTDACAIGRGRLWSFHYRNRDLTLANKQVGSNQLTYGPERVAVKYNDPSNMTVDNGDTGLFNISVSEAEKNLLVLGLGTTQRPQCGLGDEPITSYFTPSLPGIHKPAQPPALWIVGQASGEGTDRKRAGSQLSSLEVKVGRNVSFSNIASWAGSVE